MPATDIVQAEPPRTHALPLNPADAAPAALRLGPENVAELRVEARPAEAKARPVPRRECDGALELFSDVCEAGPTEAEMADRVR